jgi:Fe-S-cluster containining protein
MEQNFKCVRCGNCCKWSGYVRISQNEINLIADYLDMTIDNFIDKYTRLTSDRRGLSLIENPDGSCIFYKESPSGCEINDVKPIQCRNFPFIWNFEGWEKECRGTGGIVNC